MIQAYQSLKKYFQYPVVYQESATSINTIETPTIQICFNGFYDYVESSKNGYTRLTDFITGRIPNSSRPTWKGIDQNSNFQILQQIVHEQDFSKVEVSNPTDLVFVLGKGFCLQIKSDKIGREIMIASKKKNLSVFLVHNTTDTTIMPVSNKHTQIEIGTHSKGNFDFKDYELSYEIQDNTVYDGTTCTDYRKQQKNFGDCNYEALKDYFFSNLGCYPPWMKKSQGKHCETDIQSAKVEHKLQDQIWKNIYILLGGVKIDLMKQCLEPCYQVKVTFEQRSHITWGKFAVLNIFDNVESVRTLKAVNSFDIFMLMVELGSELGLWLGRNHCINN